MDFLNWDTPQSDLKEEGVNSNQLTGSDSLDGLNYNANNTPNSNLMKSSNNNNSSNMYNSQRSNSNGTPGSYSNVGPSPGSGSYGGHTPDYSRSTKDDATSPGIRASLSRALSNNNNGSNSLASTVNFPIPEEEEEDDDEENDGDEHNPYAYEANNGLSSSVASGRGSTSVPSSLNNSRRNTAASPAASTNSPVDRKRRDNINEKIQELLSLIPRPFFDENKDKSTGTKDGKPNKGQILSKSVEYISYLQAQIDERNRKEVELSIKLRNLEIANSIPVEKRMNLLHTSAEIGLARIGVGPLAEQQEEELQQQNVDESNSGSNVDTPNK